MTAPIVLALSLIVIPAAIMLWDLWLYRQKRRCSISQAIIDFSWYSPFCAYVIGFISGLLAAHWFLGAWAI